MALKCYSTCTKIPDENLNCDLSDRKKLKKWNNGTGKREMKDPIEMESLPKHKRPRIEGATPVNNQEGPDKQSSTNQTSVLCR